MNEPALKDGKMEKQKFFSIKSGIKFFLRSNLLLSILTFIFILNKSEWYSGSTYVEIFVILAELFIILFSFIACFKPGEEKKRTIFEKNEPKEWIGLLIALVFLSLFSLLFLGAGIPYPSTLIFFSLVSNAMVTAYSILFHPIALGAYQANVFHKKNTVFDYVFKYVAIYLSGISYHVQMLLFKVPILIHKLIVIIFVLFLLWQVFGVVAIFDL